MLAGTQHAGVDLGRFVAGVTAEDLDGWMSQMQTTQAGISLPRFTATFGTPLPSALTALGMGVAFIPNKADFSGICQHAYVSDVEHKTVVEVDESGTVATGATTVTIRTTESAAPSVNLTLDHPFLYAIRDNQTGELLFIGVLMNPSRGPGDGTRASPWRESFVAH
jgi:serine protease inhibitor